MWVRLSCVVLSQTVIIDTEYILYLPISFALSIHSDDVQDLLLPRNTPPRQKRDQQYKHSHHPVKVTLAATTCFYLTTVMSDERRSRGLEEALRRVVAASLPELPGEDKDERRERTVEALKDGVLWAIPSSELTTRGEIIADPQTNGDGM